MSETQAELDWWAVLYVSGELSADALVQFELRLATNQAAREAVARAVQLTQAIALCESQVAVASPSSVAAPAARSAPQFTRGQRWAASLTAAAVLVSLSVWQPWGATSPDVSREMAPAVVSLWAERSDDSLPANDLLLAENTNESDLLMADLDSVDVPEWLFVALEAERSPMRGTPEIMHE